MKSNKILFFVLAVVILIGLVYGLCAIFMRAPSPQSPSQTKIAYDAKTTIPNTGITISYPKNGYNGQGITLEKNNRAILSVFESTANLYVSSLPSGTPQISINIYELGAEKTLEDALAIVGTQMTDLPLGHYQEINGTRYFFVPSDSSNELYAAYAIVKGRLLAVTFNGGFDENNRDTTPEFVTRFLSHLDFTCASDCSINSAPVTEAFRGEQ